MPAIAVAVDPPQRHAEASARAFLSEQRAIGRIDFVLGSRRELRPVWDGFHIAAQSVTQEHQARFTLVDARGYQRVGFPGFAATPRGWRTTCGSSRGKPPSSRARPRILPPR